MLLLTKADLDALLDRMTGRLIALLVVNGIGTATLTVALLHLLS